MPKLPFMRFYPADYLLATRVLTDTEKAVWMDILCYMWLKPKQRGSLDMHIEDMSRMLGRDRLTVRITLDALKVKGVCDLESREDQTVFVECRRMIRDDKDLKMNNLRQKRFNASTNGRLTVTLTPKKSEVRSQKSDRDSIAGPPQTPKPLTDVQKIVTAFKMLQGYPKDDKAWDTLNFARFSKPAKQLLDFIGNWRDAIDCAQDVYEKFTAKGLTVTLETICKHASEWKKDRQEKVGGGNGVHVNAGNGSS